MAQARLTKAPYRPSAQHNTAQTFRFHFGQSLGFRTRAPPQRGKDVGESTGLASPSPIGCCCCCCCRCRCCCCLCLASPRLASPRLSLPVSSRFVSFRRIGTVLGRPWSVVRRPKQLARSVPGLDVYDKEAGGEVSPLSIAQSEPARPNPHRLSLARPGPAWSSLADVAA
ncbi:unnamed protein product [Protopolystoma xenopodis]|uniref:Uncharacterized protein n=1 Tax=Protopolystoma xenopodis TaxID=117903 RepID=A0A448WTA1_9PLAT|nr:unnamed protein product [Protopolystoma xenopodis]